jgi:nitroreductase
MHYSKRAFILLNLLSIATINQGRTAVNRTPENPVIEPIINRWSPRTMSGELLSQKELMSLFEAARWAPSSFNSQPWRFVYAERGTQAWEQFKSFLVEFNQKWCDKAAALIVLISKNNFDHDGSFSRTHSFDAGAAWENLALQGSSMGLVVHGMSGFDYDRVKKELSIPEGYTVEMMIAVGKPGHKRSLDSLKEIEEVSDRKPVSEIVMKDKFEAK